MSDETRFEALIARGLLERMSLTFSNGYGISIVRGAGTYGGAQGLYEIGPRDRNGLLDGSLLDEEDQGDDVLGYLDRKRVQYYLRKLAAL